MDTISPALHLLEGRGVFYQHLRYGIIITLAIGFFISAIVILAKDSNNNETASWFFLASVLLFLILLILKYGISMVRNCWDCIQKKRKVIPGSNEGENETLLERSYNEKGSESGSQSIPFRVEKTSYGSTDENFLFPGFVSNSDHGQQTSSTDQVATLDPNGAGVSISKKNTEEGNSSEEDDDTLVDSGPESGKKGFSSKDSSVDSQRRSPSLGTENQKEDEKEEAPPPTTVTTVLKENGCYDSSASITSSYHTACSELYDRKAMPQYEFSNK